jgi:hypothetical protein
MTTATVNRLTEVTSIEGPARRGRKVREKTEAPVPRFFMGEAATNTISLTQEFKSEAEAQLESLKLSKPYYSVEAFKAVADLSNGSVAVEKRAVSSRT